MNELFNPLEYIEILGGNLALCSNPTADGGMSAITVNLSLNEVSKRNFRDAVRRMVLAKLFSPKFAEVILAALDMGVQQRKPA